MDAGRWRQKKFARGFERYITGGMPRPQRLKAAFEVVQALDAGCVPGDHWQQH